MKTNNGDSMIIILSITKYIHQRKKKAGVCIAVECYYLYAKDSAHRFYCSTLSTLGKIKKYILRPKAVMLISLS